MATIPVRAMRTALIALISANISISAQTTTPAAPKDSLAVTLAVQKTNVTIGQSPWAILTVENLTDHEVAIPGYMYRVHVDGKTVEAPTTLAQRRLTRKLRPGEYDLRGDELGGVWTIASGQSGVHKFQLTYLYDLSAPGEYKVYAEVQDPSSKKWLRTNSVTFDMQAQPQ